MINGLEGIPRSGKSYEATIYHVLHAVASGRMVITNLPLFREKFMAIDPAYGSLIVLKRKPSPILGTWDANRTDDDGNGSAFELFADGHQEPPDVTTTVFGHVWDYYTTWKHPETGAGPLFVIDECHVGLPKIGTDKQVVEWFKLHGHFNVDVLLMTQNFRDMNQSIAPLLEMLVRVRKASFIGNPTHYIRKVYAGYRGAVISTEERPYKKQYFGLYKSHTQGNSVAESVAADVKPFIVRFKRWTRIMWFVIFLGACFVGWRIFSPSKSVKTVTVTKNIDAVPLPLAGSSAPRSASSDHAPADSEVIPEPYENQSVHMTGRIRMGERESYTFTIAQNGLVVNYITDADLRKAGYQFKGTSDCTGVLTWNKAARAVSCNFPSQQMAAQGMEKKS